MGLVYSGSVAGKAAVQGALTQAEIDAIADLYPTAVLSGVTPITATAAGDITAAANALTGAKNTAIQALAAASFTDTGIAQDTDTGTNGTQYATLTTLLGQIAAQRLLATAAQDATQLGALSDLEADIATALNVDDVNAAAALAAAIEGTAAVDAVASKIVLEKRMNVYMNADVETSSGLTFGASVMIRSNEGATMMNGARVYMKSGNLEVGVGNIYGAIEWMPNLYNAIGLTGLGFDNVGGTVARGANWDAYSSSANGAEGVEVIYSAGGFVGHLSYSDATLSKGSSAHKRVAGAVAYTMGDWTVALATQNSDVAAEDKTIVTVGGKVGDFGVKLAAADNDGVSKVSLAGSATFGATTITATISDDESATDNYMGLGLSHDLGGAKLNGGVVRTASGQTLADLGVSFSF